MAPVLMADPGEGLRHFVRHLAEDASMARRVGLVARALTDPRLEARSSSAHCEVAARLAHRVGLDDAVSGSLAHAFERWDGKGHPAGLAGDDVPVAVRVVAAARDAELFGRSGWPTAVEVLMRRRDRAYDPVVVDALVDGGRGWLAELGDDPCAHVLDAEPAPVRTIQADALDAALGAIADFADLKSPWFRGHSTGVAHLAAGAAEAAGRPAGEAVTLGRAALVHDVGQVGVPSGVWDRPAQLTTEQWERVRLHPYLSERVLGRCALTSPFAALAGRHHERADGSGYHRGLGGDQLDTSARLLAASDSYHAMTEARPYRPALRSAEAAARLRQEADSGRFGRAEVDAVLAAAGHAGAPVRHAHPAGLTTREVEVLTLIARGYANKQVAAELGIATKTVGHHIEHVYAKAGVTTRAGATLFAMEHGLLSRRSQ
jgi:HD-GYP domain-containing protein (c-di-GMP phosphodiesterase class II)